jgi:hypothetical protein
MPHAATGVRERRIATIGVAAVSIRAHRASLFERDIRVLTWTAQLAAARMSSLA